MKIVIDIPEEVKQAFDCAESNDLKGCYYDHGGVVGNAIKNGVPIKNVTNAEEAEAYQINQEDKSRILRDIANIKDLPICKECRFCKHCMKDKKLPKIIFEKGYPFIYCARHHEHFSPYGTCEFFDKEAENERNKDIM